MKRICTLVTALGCAAIATAQSVSEPSPAVRARHQALFARLQNNAQATAHKTTANKQRVVAESSWSISQGNATWQDSTRYFYSGANGSAYNLNEFDFNYYYHALYNSPYGMATDMIMPGVKADSAHYYYLINNVRRLGEKLSMTYYNNDNIASTEAIEYSTQGTVAGGTRMINSYDGQGRKIRAVALALNGNQWDSTDKRFFRYNAQGQIAADSLFNYSGGNWIPEMRQTYVYDASGKLIQLNSWEWYTNSGWKQGTMSNITYTANGLMEKLETSVDTGNGPLCMMLRDSMAYAPGTRFFNYYLHSGNINLRPIYRITKHLNAQNLPDTAWHESNNGTTWTLTRKIQLAYNSERNPTSVITTINSNGFAEYFYYETYNDPTHTGEVAHGQAFRVYPNPAVSSLTIEKGNAAAQQELSIVLTGLNGVKVYSEHISGGGNTLRIPLDGLPSGTYVLTIYGQKGERLYGSSVVRQ